MTTARLVRMNIFNAVAVVSTGNAESSTFDLVYTAQVEAVVLRAKSASGAPDVKLQHALSHDGTNFDAYADNTDWTASSATAKPNNAQGYNSYIPPSGTAAGRYIKFKVTGVGSNPAGTVVNAYMIFREGVR